MPKKSQEVTVPMSEELEELIVEPLEFGDHKSERIRELIRQGLEADGVDPDRIPPEDDQRTKQQEPDGGQTVLAGD
jgi:hypothetical protein